MEQNSQRVHCFDHWESDHHFIRIVKTCSVQSFWRQPLGKEDLAVSTTWRAECGPDIEMGSDPILSQSCGAATMWDVYGYEGLPVMPTT